MPIQTLTLFPRCHLSRRDGIAHSLSSPPKPSSFQTQTVYRHTLRDKELKILNLEPPVWKHVETLAQLLDLSITMNELELYIHQNR